MSEEYREVLKRLLNGDSLYIDDSHIPCDGELFQPDEVRGLLFGVGVDFLSMPEGECRLPAERMVTLRAEDKEIRNVLFLCSRHVGMLRRSLGPVEAKAGAEN